MAQMSQMKKRGNATERDVESHGWTRMNADAGEQAWWWRCASVAAACSLAVVCAAQADVNNLPAAPPSERVKVWTGLLLGYDHFRWEPAELNDSLRVHHLPTAPDRHGAFTFGWLTIVKRLHIQVNVTLAGRRMDNDTSDVRINRTRSELWMGYDVLKAEKWHLTPFTGYSFASTNYRVSDTDDAGTFGAQASSIGDDVHLRHVAHLIPLGLKFSRGSDGPRLTIYGGALFTLTDKWQNAASNAKVGGGPALAYPWFAGVTLDLGSGTENPGTR